MNIIKNGRKECKFVSEEAFPKQTKVEDKYIYERRKRERERERGIIVADLKDLSKVPFTTTIIRDIVHEIVEMDP